jgi:hypothetical protein
MTSTLNYLSLLAFTSAILVTSTSLFAVTSFVPAPNFAADSKSGSAEWDIFTSPDGSQGAAPFTAGSNVPTSTELNINVLVPIETPGGLLAGGDSYYSHSGAYGFEVQTAFSVGVDFARVSYALVGSQGAPAPFPISPDIVDATSLNSGSYSDSNNNTVFYSDFDLGGTKTDITATFGDTPAPFSSFRSINGVRIEALSSAPIPEPSSAALLLIGLSFVARRKR